MGELLVWTFWMLVFFAIVVIVLAKGVRADTWRHDAEHVWVTFDVPKQKPEEE